ncbi:MAG: lysophospholipid acyltransferase family protein [Fusicatenibacter sp.]|nr:lysophospholipid acyltransferase family protein [Fusicatenibacter sp.]
MKRILLMVLRNLFMVPWMWCRLCYHAKYPDKYTLEEHFLMLHEIVRRANKGGNITIKSYGEENLPKEDGFVMFPNHQGMYDVLAITAACQRTYSVVAKKEIKDIPFLKQVFSCIHAYYIDREDLRQSMQVIGEVANEVKAGKNFIIFPEGTRSKMGNKLLDFKGGTFKCAVKAGKPIVPVALVNSFVPFDSHSIKEIIVEVHFLKPLYPEEYRSMKTSEIAQWAKSEIEKTIANSEAALW